MKIIITGASSYVGASIYFQLKKKYPVVGTYNSHKLFPELHHLDITKEQEVNDFIVRERPNVIVHAAANASGSWCEQHPEMARTINQQGTMNIVNSANLVNSQVLLISSFAAADPRSVYGRTKLESEEAVRETKVGYVILRPSLILGLSPNTANDRPFNRLLRNITDKTPPAYDSSWKFQPTWLHHLENVVEEIIERGIVNETIPVSLLEVKTRYDLARDILSEFDIDAIPEDKHDTSYAVSEDLSKLRELGLPIYTYSQMRSGIIKEIKTYLDRV